MKDYIQSGFEIIGAVIIEASSICGVTKTWDMNIAFDVLAEEELTGVNREKINKKGIDIFVVEGRGYFIQELKREFKRK
jgi:ferredoxin-fold anticodon binding domain-containing protein